MLHLTDTAESSSVEFPLTLTQTEEQKKRKEYSVRFIRAGKIKARGGGDGRYIVEAGAIRDAVAERLFDGRPNFVDHPDWWSGSSLRNMAAYIVSAEWNADDESADGVIKLYQTDAGQFMGVLLGDYLDDKAAGGAVPDLGLSLVFFPKFAPRDNEDDPLRVTGIRFVESVDFVFQPAADGRIKKALAATMPGGNMHKGSNSLAAGGNVTDPAVSSAVTNEEGAAGEQVLAWGQNQLAAGELWVGALRAAGVEHALSVSGLPPATRERLAKGTYPNPAALDQAIQEARDELAANNAHAAVRLTGGAPRSGVVTFGQEAIKVAENAMDYLFGVAGAATPPPHLRRSDLLYVALTGDVEFRGIFDPAALMFAAATTTTLADLAVNAMNRVLVEQFKRLVHWRWYEKIVMVSPNDGSLQPMQWITFGGVGNLPTVAEGASYTELTVGDVRENDAFVKKGGYVGITREMIKNSAIGLIQAVPRALAVAAVRTRSAAISALFTQASGTGPTLDQDSTVLFHANHSNVATTALGTDATAWRAARTECFKHTEVNSSKRLGIYPKFLLVPADLYDQSLAILGYGEGMPTTYTPEAQDRGFADPRAVPVVVPDWTDATDWAYIVDPEVYPVIHMSYSQLPGGGSHPAPELFSVQSATGGLQFTNDTLPIKVRDEFAAGVNGHRGIGKRNVA